MTCSAGPQDAEKRPDEPAEDKGDSTLRLAVNDSLPTLDPFLQNTVVSEWVLAKNVFEGLVRLEDGLPQPCLASGWMQHDELTWVFAIRRGVVFHDGRELSAEDVVASIERARSHRETAISSRVVQVSSVLARDAHTVEVGLVAPWQVLLNRVARVPVVAGADTEGPLESLIGTGPYRVAAHQTGEFLELERHPDYWGETPPIDRAQSRDGTAREGSCQGSRARS